jgi:hypothetical protein
LEEEKREFFVKLKIKDVDSQIKELSKKINLEIA